MTEVITIPANCKVGFIPPSIEECPESCSGCFLIKTYSCHYPGKQKNWRLTHEERY